MSALPSSSNKMTEAEYFALERDSDVRHEFVDGEVYAMRGASKAHNTIVLNIAGFINTPLRCHDGAVRLAAGGGFTVGDMPPHGPM